MEHRLIGYTLSDFNDPTKYNSRIAEANAQQQASQHQAQVQLNQSSGQTVNPNMKTAAPVATNPMLAQAQTVYGAKPGEQTVYQNPNNGTIGQAVNIPDGNIALNAFNRLTGDNNLGVDMSQQDAATKLNDPSYKQGIRTATNGVGQAGVDITGRVPLTPQQLSDKAAADAEAKLQELIKSGKQVDQTTAMQIVSQARQNALLQHQAEQNQQNQQILKGNQNAASTAAAGTNADQTAKTGANPATAGSSLALQNLPPEFASVGQALQGVIDANNQSLTDNQKAFGEMAGTIDTLKKDLKTQVGDLAKTYKSTSDATEVMLKEVRDRNEKFISDSQKAAEDRLAWDSKKEERRLSKEKQKVVDSKIASLAIRGGFGSDGGLREIDEAGFQYEQAIMDLQTEVGIQRTELAAKFTGLYVEAQNNYALQSKQNIDNLVTRLGALSQQDMTNKTAIANAENSLIEKFVTTQTATRKDTAKQIYDGTKEIQTLINQDRDDKRAQEETALNRIDYLLKNYPRESVAEAIKELGAKVTSFDVQALIANPTLAEITRAEAAMKKRSSGGGGGYATSFLPAGMQEPLKPEVSLDDFMQQKMTALESAASQSFAPAKRAELMAQNADKWEKEHEAIYMSGPTGAAVGQAKSELVQQFGQTVVDAAQLVMDGTYTGTDPVGKAAKAMGVPASQVATALTKLKQTGAVAETAVLSPAQQKSRDTIISGLKTDPFYTVWNGSKSAVTRINTAIGDNGGADGLSDIMAINAFQNGIVDPGATVREGDVSLMQTAIAWADLVQLDYWKERISDGDKLPASMRQKMLQLATATRDAYGRDFQAETIPRVRSLIQQNGLPSTVLDTHLGTSTATTVSPNVSSFVDSLSF